MPGLPGIIVRVKNKNNKEEMVTAVRTAREEMTVRTGARGVPVLLFDNAFIATVREGLLSATIQGGTIDKAERVITYTGSNIPDQVGEEEVSGWLAGHDKGEEERDLLTDPHICRGWEAQAVMVVNTTGYYGVENLVMRGRTCVALVTTDNC